MPLLVPGDAVVLVLGGHGLPLNSVLLEQLEECHIASQLDRPQLVIIPVLSVDTLGVDCMVPEIINVHIGAVTAYVSTQPNKCVSGLLCLAVNAVFVVWVSKLLLKELLELSRLGKIARFEILFLFLSRLGSSLGSLSLGLRFFFDWLIFCGGLHNDSYKMIIF